MAGNDSRSAILSRGHDSSLVKECQVFRGAECKNARTSGQSLRSGQGLKSVGDYP